MNENEWTDYIAWSWTNCIDAGRRDGIWQAAPTFILFTYFYYCPKSNTIPIQTARWNCLGTELQSPGVRPLPAWCGVFVGVPNSVFALREPDFMSLVVAEEMPVVYAGKDFHPRATYLHTYQWTHFRFITTLSNIRQRHLLRTDINSNLVISQKLSKENTCIMRKQNCNKLITQWFKYKIKH